MCSISVEPMPSTMSTPKWRLKRSPISPGSASPADDASLSATSSRFFLALFACLAVFSVVGIYYLLCFDLENLLCEGLK
jgi:hypothetical protein